MASHSLQWTHTSQGVITTGTLTNTYTVTTTDTTTTVSGSVTLKVKPNSRVPFIVHPVLSAFVSCSGRGADSVVRRPADGWTRERFCTVYGR